MFVVHRSQLHDTRLALSRLVRLPQLYEGWLVSYCVRKGLEISIVGNMFHKESSSDEVRQDPATSSIYSKLLVGDTG